MNDSINLKNPDLVVKHRPIKPKQKFLYQLYTKVRQQKASGLVYKSADTSACAMFMITKIDKANEARFLHDSVARNRNTIMVPPNIPHQSSIINTIVRYLFRSKIDRSDAYHNIRIHHTGRCTVHLLLHMVPMGLVSFNRGTAMSQPSFSRS